MKAFDAVWELKVYEDHPFVKGAFSYRLIGWRGTFISHHRDITGRNYPVTLA